MGKMRSGKFQDIFFMREALSLALKARGKTSPNPLVGALIVRKGKILAQGFHHRAGAEHAEILALQSAGQKARGATLYVTLEPCTHWGRTAPCVDAVVASGVKRVVIAIKDPNPMVHGKSLQLLKKAGIEVTVGVLEKEARNINEIFFTNMLKKRPFVSAKWAQSIDGKITDSRGVSRWVTAGQSRSYGRKLRGFYDSVCVGIGTILADDPYLETPGKKMVKVILDPHLKTPQDARIFRSYKNVFIIADRCYHKARNVYRENVHLVFLRTHSGCFSLQEVLEILYRKNIMSVFVEGGPETLGRFFDTCAIDKIYVFLAGKIFGGRDSRSAISGQGITDIRNPIVLRNRKEVFLGNDILLIGNPVFHRSGILKT